MPCTHPDFTGSGVSTNRYAQRRNSALWRSGAEPDGSGSDSNIAAIACFRPRKFKSTSQTASADLPASHSVVGYGAPVNDMPWRD
jgi:hypothetical protein